LSARLVQDSKFDGIWESSLTDSASKGLPDIELVSGDSRLNTIREIREVSDKPIVVDWDTGGQVDHFPYWVKRLEQAGVDAVVIEDKAFPKRNSLDKKATHILEDIDKFSEKIICGKGVAKEMMIIARLESLIAKHSMYEALVRAEAFLKAGADGIMIHSKSEVSADEVLSFMKKFRKDFKDVPLMVVPTTYNHIPDKELEKAGANIICHANHLLRASYKAMKEVIDAIYKNGKSEGLDIATVQDIFNTTRDKDKS
jgi:phosphoenolpyruvate phosphomutase